jgi:DNA repair protein RecO (recombination protein O)
MEKVTNGRGKSGLSPPVIPLVSDTLAQGDHRADGVVLRRREQTPKSRECLLFLRNYGAVWVGAPGEKNRFGGGTEPMIWGNFVLYQSPRRLYLKSVDIAEDFLPVRMSRRMLTMAVKWCAELAGRLPLGHANDSVLSLFWGCMKNLSQRLSTSLLDARFAWRWGNIWGVAPSMDACPWCGLPFDGSVGLSRTPEGFVCDNCVRNSDEGIGDDVYKIPVSPEVFEAMRFAALSGREFFTQEALGNDAVLRSNAVLSDEATRTVGWLYSFLRLV